MIILLAVTIGCKKEGYLMYNDGHRIQMSDTTTQSFSFFYEAAAVTRDTIYIKLNTIGGITDYNRSVTVEQIPEFDYTYKYDSVTSKVIDSTAYPKSNPAIAGKHYVSFTDPGALAIMYVQADSAIGSLPIILLRDASLKDSSCRLRIRITANDEFMLGEKNAMEKTIIFSDRLERFESWKFDNFTSPAYGTLGKYSTGKHQFMIDVLKVRIDEAWWQAIFTAQAITHYKNYLRDALQAFNADPANIASGKAPVRESNNPASTPISFPN
ncbi:DUF4843 domain-containing protein [Niastella yeongjuensis]|uniref:DUF4843 domain-containing protein n=1 Tax=Niastella yeongjuensis TaxID=354355 RepID=A0A1V9EB83_9BACT|nr:DUF4843 domain-containing protein [Niastella yeongjuensis]